MKINPLEQVQKKERPILFSAAMVLAILAGRKTQTRRLVKPQPVNMDGLWPDPQSHICWHDVHAAPEYYAGCGACPNGKLGDRLWVKETHARLHDGLLAHLDPEPDNGTAFNNGWWTHYRADGEPADWKHYGLNWKPSIFMRRQFSRINLEITRIRVERLQDISGKDAIAEGVTPVTRVDGAFKGRTVYGGPLWENHECRRSPIDAYQRIWEEINGVGSWAENPWVWVIEFRRLES